MTIHYDLSDTLQPYPLQAPVNASPLPNLQALGSLLTRRTISPLASAAAGIAGRLHIANPEPMFTPVKGLQDAHETIVRWQGRNGILRLTPDDAALSPYNGVAQDIPLLNGFRLPTTTLLEQDGGKTLVMSSPNGISGQIASLPEIVDLARHFRLVVIDERLAAFNLRRLNALVLEWENIVFVQRFPFRMPGNQSDFAWFLHPTALGSQLREHTHAIPPSTIEDVLTYGGTNSTTAARRVARLKSQLYRELRKLSIVSVPYPSWSNSLLARVERGDRDDIVQQLAERGIAVYAPPHDNLRQHFRVTAISQEATIALRDALIDINRTIG